MNTYRIQYCEGVMYGGRLIKEEYVKFDDEKTARKYAAEHMPRETTVYYVCKCGISN